MALLSRGCELPPALPAGHGQVQVREQGGSLVTEILTYPPTHPAFHCEVRIFAFSASLVSFLFVQR